MIDRDFLRYQPWQFHWLAVSAVAMVVGVFGPWLAVAGGSGLRSGLHGRGWLVLLCGLLAVGVTLALGKEVRHARYGLVLVAAAAAFSFVECWTFIEPLRDQPILPIYGRPIKPGWGVVADLIGSLSLVAAVGYSIVKTPEEWRP
jgi:hypothetical protein